MQDSLKKILSDRKNLNEGDVVITKMNGKLKSKYILHSVAPTWHNFLNLHGNRNHKSFELLLEKTISNVLDKINELNLKSIAFPSISMSSTPPSNIGCDAFDLPIELFVHTIFMQLIDFEIKSNEKRIECLITSLERDKLQKICDLFINYFDMYSLSGWALPVSPLATLMKDLNIEDDTESEKTNLTSDLPSSNTNKNKTIQNKSSRNTEAKSSSLRNSSGDLSCLFCQKDETDSNSLIQCGNQTCLGSFCLACISNFLKAQKTDKCPSCKLPIIENEILKSLSTVTKEYLPFNTVSNNLDDLYDSRVNRKKNQSSLINQPQIYPKINEGEIYVRKINKSCEGYEQVKSLLITFEIPDGVFKFNPDNKVSKLS